MSLFQDPEEEVKEFLAGNPIMSEFEAKLRYYNVSNLTFFTHK